MTSPWLLALGIVALTLVAEDGATLTAVALSASQSLDPRLAFAACFGGIWLGDLGLYAVARRFGRRGLEHRWLRTRVSQASLHRAEQWFQSRGVFALVICRFVPGTRLPTFLAAGTLRMPLATFAAVTAACAAFWVGAAFALGESAVARMFLMQAPAWALPVALATLFLIPLAARKLPPMRGLRLAIQKYSRWEFWPAWLFYVPVAAMCGWLGLRHRGFTLPTIANPSQRNGGIVGESKAEIMEQLQRVAAEHSAKTFLIPPGDVYHRISVFKHAFLLGQLSFPCVLKPNVGQRGAGFRKIHTLPEARAYLTEVPSPMVLQEYAPGPHEAGIFYVRQPGESTGGIFAITAKSFPEVVGDGSHTLAEFIEADPRARLIAATYRQRFSKSVDQVIPAGERMRLVEAGNHCQGCIFEDGMHLASPELREQIDRISRALPGFYVGRYDVRYESEDKLRAGQFTIIELNGAASEATSIYDARNSLLSAYCTLYRQWQMVFRIGALNRARGYKPASPLALWHDWCEYRRQAAFYPAAD